MKKTYRSAGGKKIDLHSLMLKNEEVRAVGNMNVNARGDVISPENKKVASRSQQVNKQYRKQIGNVAQDIPVSTSKKAAEAAAHEVAEEFAKAPMQKIDGLDNDEVTEIAEDAEVESNLEETEKGGLASAIAKVKEVKQQPQKSPREQERGGDGVKKI